MKNLFLALIACAGFALSSCEDNPTSGDPNGTKVVFRMYAAAKYDSILCGVVYLPKNGPDAIVTAKSLRFDGDTVLFELGDVQYFTPICTGHSPGHAEYRVHDEKLVPDRPIRKYIYEIRVDTVIRITE